MNNFHLHKDDREERIKELISLVGLSEEQLERYPHEFSGGQKQRISIARALAIEPEFLIADEPTAALDVSIQAQILNLLMELRERLGLSMLFISHDLGVVKHISDNLIVMYLGKIVESGPTNEIFEKPLHPYTRSLLSAMPLGPLAKKREIISLSGSIPSPVDPPSGCRLHPRCPFARRECESEEPPLVSVSKHRFAACHFCEENIKF